MPWCQGRLLAGTASSSAPRCARSAPRRSPTDSGRPNAEAQHVVSRWDLFMTVTGKLALWKILLSVKFLFPPTFLSRVCTEPTLMLTHFSPCSHGKLCSSSEGHVMICLERYSTPVSSATFIANLNIVTFLPKLKWNSLCPEWAEECGASQYTFKVFLTTCSMQTTPCTCWFWWCISSRLNAWVQPPPQQSHSYWLVGDCLETKVTLLNPFLSFLLGVVNGVWKKLWS